MESGHQSPGTRSGLSRRTLLRAGFTGLAAAAASGGVWTAHASESTTYDVIIIGAGFAGITAARALSARGLRPLVLEARNRIGGRAWTTTFNDMQVEMGGTWVDPKQPNTWREVQRHGMPLVTDLDAEFAILPTSSGYQRFTMSQVVERQAPLVQRLMEGSQDYLPDPYDAFSRSDLLASVDGLSLRDRLNQLNLTADEELSINGLTSSYAGGSSARGALTMLAHWWALCGRTYEGLGSINVQRLAPGMNALAKAMLAEASKATLKLNSPVKSVDDDGRTVRVTTRSGEQFTASAAVVAVPVNVWKRISFTPGLPTEHTSLSTQTVGAPNAKKMWLHVRGDVGHFLGESPEGAGPLAAVFPYRDVSDGQIMIASSVDPALNVNDRAAIERGVRVFAPNAQVVSVKGQDWGSDEFSLGGWSFRRPGQMTTSLRAVQAPRGRLTFATSDIALAWSGYIDGAIESGQRAADQVVSMMSRMAA
ncbi:flavin monoamine oxidase family protein [Saccharothrix deserti]|uniref:flavin monoamine oxidase family protein n=1 Tax=Saccharothrix deserti TaxID=2593674 RepID=UPI00131B513A|nr:NAD(P)/FAD-dependent oxidoreductase [Saccharothrix deserti]